MTSLAPTDKSIPKSSLVALGEGLRAGRKRQKVSGTTAAESAGVSRVTLHRVERGEPSVAMGSYMRVAAALGMDIVVADPQAARPSAQRPHSPTSIRLADYPQLQHLAWQLHGAAEVTPVDALSLYERNWRHLDHGATLPHERALIETLAATAGGGRLLV